MSQDNYLSVKQQSNNLQFSSLADLNKKLLPTPIGEYLKYDGVVQEFLQFKKGVQFWNRDFAAYQNSTNIYSCMTDEVFQLIANHIVQGVLILEINYDSSGETVYFELTPCKVSEYQ